MISTINYQSNNDLYTTSKNDIYKSLLYSGGFLLTVNVIIFLLKFLFIKASSHFFKDSFLSKNYSAIQHVYKLLIYKLFAFLILKIIIFAIIFRKNIHIFKNKNLKYIFALQMISILAYHILVFIYISNMPQVFEENENNAIKNNLFHEVSKKVIESNILEVGSITKEHLKLFEPLIQQYCIVSSIIIVFYSIYLIISVALSNYPILNVIIFILFHIALFYILLGVKIFSIAKMSKKLFLKLIITLTDREEIFKRLGAPDQNVTAFEKILYYCMTVIVQIFVALTVSLYINYYMSERDS